MKKIKEIGEFGIIGRISRRTKTDRSVMLGIGDDAAVIKTDGDKCLLFASDMIVEGVHFDLKKAKPFDIGWKALCVNISDIAAMGGVPRYACVSAGINKNTKLRSTDGIYSGILSAARRFGVNIVGGDTSSSDKLVIDVSIIGEARKGEIIYRSGAKPGDVILVTGTLGGSIKGKHLKFTPRIRESQFLVKNFKINSMIDISDGLSSDLSHICKSSGVGAKIYESLIPLSKDARSVKSALSDGEDYELLFTVPKKGLSRMIKRFKKRSKTPLAVIGEVTKKNAGIKIVDRFGRILSLTGRGFAHF
ncbi:MAG: thiamine-phosphate kinase [Candidatus Omnitrophota bacterium]